MGTGALQNKAKLNQQTLFVGRKIAIIPGTNPIR